ncbi:hypothetical protein RF11_06296 [Thelohanellus kitauei]|uniref:Uncharacterized protein n=1 Tax=Thelohanellus kitauei TaxID=669202 RepID=A0A0C2MVB7_THEKT|nr:hypothetical protein RF11_06296 [Thelohanellus kitauei]
MPTSELVTHFGTLQLSENSFNLTHKGRSIKDKVNEIQKSVVSSSIFIRYILLEIIYQHTTNEEHDTLVCLQGNNDLPTVQSKELWSQEISIQFNDLESQIIERGRQDDVSKHETLHKQSDRFSIPTCMVYFPLLIS